MVKQSEHFRSFFHRKMWILFTLYEMEKNVHSIICSRYEHKMPDTGKFLFYTYEKRACGEKKNWMQLNVMDVYFYVFCEYSGSNKTENAIDTMNCNAIKFNDMTFLIGSRQQIYRNKIYYSWYINNLLII